MSTEMSISEHISEMRSRLFRILIFTVIITVFSISFGIKQLDVGGLVLFYPSPDPIKNIAVQLTVYMEKTLLPVSVKVIQTTPGEAFFAQIYVAILLGIIGSMPVVIKEIVGFISPAFGQRTKNLSFSVIAQSLSLFIIGVSFSYVLVIPFTINFLYKYGQALGLETFLNINDFITFILQFFLGFGIAFELPLIMYAISMTGIIESMFWRKNFRYAAFILVIFGAIITPDGSGITMWFVAGPMMGLYVLGMIIIERKHRRK